MKKYLYIIAFLTIASLVGTAFNWYKNMQEYKAQYERAAINLRATEAQVNNLKNNNLEYCYTIDELKNSRDSINQKLLETAKKLKIKEKDIQYLQYQSSVITKTDTVVMEGDTIFKETMVSLDTIVGNKWYNTRLKLEYPSKIVVAPTFFSQKEVIISNKKEYVGKRSKIFFIRWFQKKQNVITVDIVEHNPYIHEEQNKFIKIVK